MEALNVRIEELRKDNPEALAHLAWHELVEDAEKGLPLLVIGNQVLKGNALVKKLTKLNEGLPSV